MSSLLGWCVRGAVAGAIFLPSTGAAQTAATPVKPLRTPPTEQFAVSAGVRDWGPATIAGTTILAGGPTGKGGLFAVDMVTGKLKWTFRPAGISGSMSTPPAVAGNVVIAPFGAANRGAVVGVSLATGRELWRGPDPGVNAAVGVHAALAFVVSKDDHLHGLEIATGREVWRMALATGAGYCASRPTVLDGVLYLSALAPMQGGPADANANYLFALDAMTGQERWRYRADIASAPYGVCLTDQIVTATTIYAAGKSYVVAVDRATGRARWKPVEVQRTVQGRERSLEVVGLVDAGSVLVGITTDFLMAFDKATGRIAWEIPGAYSTNSPSTAVAGNVLFFQGSPSTKPAPQSRGTLHALDLDTRAILWSFSRPTAEANWPFGFVTPVDGGLWVDSYQALVKLR